MNWGGASYSASLGGLTAATYTWKGPQAGAHAVSARRLFQASSYDALDNLMTENCSDIYAGYDLGYASDGSWAVFHDVDFGNGVLGLNARVASAASGASIEFRLDSPKGAEVATVSVPNTGAWQTWTTQTANAGGASGVHDLYIVYRTAPANLNWFQFQ